VSPAWLAGAVDYAEQAQVTNWPLRILLVLVVAGAIAAALWGMRRGWLARQHRQGQIPAPAQAPLDPAGLTAPVGGMFLGTSTAGDWLDRIAVHDLGVRSRARLSYGRAGVWLQRDGARDLFVPVGAIEAVRVDRGVAGTVRARDSVIIVTWRAGEALLDSGFRADDSDEHATVLDGLMATFASDLPEGRP
jgi:hypothetical protein